MPLYVYGSLYLSDPRIIPIIITPRLLIPTDVSASSLQLWLDAADSSTIIASSGTVSTWNDKSGAGYNFSSYSGTTKTNTTSYNNLNVLDFSLNGALNNASISFANNNHHFFVVAYLPNDTSKAGSTTSNYLLLSYPGNTPTYFSLNVYHLAAYYYQTGTTGAWTNTLSITPSSFTVPHMFDMANTTSNLQYFMDGSGSITTPATASTSWTGLFIGTPNVAGYYWNGYVAEIIAYKSPLNTSDRQKIEGALAWKWGLQTNLPLTHPYYYAAPTITSGTASGIVTINSLTGGNYTQGTSNTSGTTYNVFALTTPSTTYTINYTCTTATQCYVLAVGGGGCGGTGTTAGGGGGGGVVMTPITLPAGTNQTITVTVGNGTKTIQSGGFADSTTATFAAGTTPLTITAGGGGNGTSGTSSTANSVGGSLGGFYNSATTTLANNININYANGAIGAASISSGGGGAGIIAYQVKGGDGIQCFLPGIKDFSPSGTPYSTYYWGGGGGGSSAGQTPATGGQGGKGGGGSGNAQTSYTDTNGINNSGAATATVGGAGGVNTGGGGGGSTTSGGSGVGGSGIFVIAFPQASVSVNTGSVLTNASLSASAYNSIYGAYGCKLLNYNYYGPIFTLRSSADTNGTSTKNFYMDTTGANIGDGYLGTGTTLSAWLTAAGGATTYAYVSKWYDQGMDFSFNCATQGNVLAQPAFEISTLNVNFGYASGIVTPTNTYLNLPNYSFPTGDNSYTYSFKFLNVGSNPSVYLSGGTADANYNLCMIYNNTGKYIFNWWSGNVNTTITPAANDIVSWKYTKGTTGATTYYINGTSYSGAMGAARTQTSTNNYIGAGNYNNLRAKSQYKFFYVFGTSLNDTDRGIIEGT